MPDPAPGQFITVSDKTLRYQLAGDGPPLILLHGASGNLFDWTFGHFDRLAKSYRVLAFDRPGLGYSDPADTPTLLAQVKLMREAAIALDMPRATLVGHSFGGAVALAWALNAPDQVDGLALLASPSMVWPGTAGRLYDLANLPLIGYAFSRIVPLLASQSRVANAIDSIFAPQPTPEGYLQHIRPELSARPDVYRANALQVGALKDQFREMVPRYPNLKMPIELIHGSADTIVPANIHAQPFAALMPNANLTMLDGIGHMPHHTQPDALTNALKRLI